eukprot:1618238-Pyramimonas_sp.AAC.1
MGMPRKDAEIGFLPQQNVVVCGADHAACLRAPAPSALEIRTRVAQSDQAETREWHKLDGDRGAGVFEAS